MWCDGCSKPGTCPLTLVSCYVEDLRCLMNSCCERQHSPAAGCRDTSKHAKASTSCSGSGSRALQPPSPQCTLGDLIFPIQCAPFLLTDMSTHWSPDVIWPVRLAPEATGTVSYGFFVLHERQHVSCEMTLKAGDLRALERVRGGMAYRASRRI